jgi:hypothetical protein
VAVANLKMDDNLNGILVFSPPGAEKQYRTDEKLSVVSDSGVAHAIVSKYHLFHVKFMPFSQVRKKLLLLYHVGSAFLAVT